MNILVLIVSLFRFFRSSFAVFELASNIVDLLQKSLKINTFTTAKTAFVVFHVEKIFEDRKQSAATNLVSQNHI